MDGQISRQSSSYRQGLVLGLTMAEVMILMIFCLLIALAGYLRLEQTKVAAAETAPNEQGVSQAERNLLGAVKQNPALYERLRAASASPNAKAAVDEFWRDIVASQSLVDEYRKMGLTPQQARDKIAYADAFLVKGVDVATVLRDIDIVGSIQTVMPGSTGQVAPAQAIIEIIQRGLKAESTAGHQWPPIISLSEANGYYFKTGSAELSPKLRLELTTSTPQRIADLIKQYHVDLIEVVGHTDEQPIGGRPSNLDSDLLPVLRSDAPVGSLVPADNAGLGLARAVSVVSVLRQSKLLEGYKLIPLSGAQLVNTDETLAIYGMPGDIPERRRIEIRLRKSSPHEASAGPMAVPLPKPKPLVARQPPVSPPRMQSPSSPLPLRPIH